ncbi:hypothetical protein [uncultured Microbacterium sp.]|uniref:gp53-like domain-containing protein n=1 Tax=uncultured Microbacterium sp. TaxID=191216 RepID=UPI0025E7626F|nr:hypothetical protein [uncultured Microbacterium sp.]
MAVNSYDPTMGYPKFLDTDAPDVAVNPTEVAKYAADVGNRIIRANLAGLDAYAYKRAGLLGEAADTGKQYRHTGSGWAEIGAGRVDANANPGAAISGITVPNAAVSLPQGLIVKTGILTATTSVAFGNEYMPRIVFGTPFPTSLLSVHIMQVHVSSAASMHPNAATDDATKTGFRVLYSGTTSATTRSFMWTAFGY